jgi:hypothetical protein
MISPAQIFYIPFPPRTLLTLHPTAPKTFPERVYQQILALEAAIKIVEGAVVAVAVAALSRLLKETRLVGKQS